MKYIAVFLLGLSLSYCFNGDFLNKSERKIYYQLGYLTQNQIPMSQLEIQPYQIKSWIMSNYIEECLKKEENLKDEEIKSCIEDLLLSTYYGNIYDIKIDLKKRDRWDISFSAIYKFIKNELISGDNNENSND